MVCLCFSRILWRIFIMKITKILGAASAAVVSAAVVAASASANEAFLMYASSDWSVQCMDAASENATNADVTGNGTYTVSISGFEWEDEETAEMVPATATGATVFCIDIADLATDLGCGKGSDAYEALGSSATAADKMAVAQAAGVEFSNVVITATNTDGSTTDIPVDESKLIWGDIEGNGKIRLEIFNAYGDTSKDAPIDAAGFSFDDTLSVTFTISGVGGDAAAADDTAADDATDTGAADDTATAPEKGSPDTGVEGIAAVAGVAVLAAGAVLVSKKRK